MKFPEKEIQRYRDALHADDAVCFVDEIIDYANFANVELYRLQGIINDLRAELAVCVGTIAQVQGLLRLHGAALDNRQPAEARFVDPDDWE